MSFLVYCQLPRENLLKKKVSFMVDLLQQIDL